MYEKTYSVAEAAKMLQYDFNLSSQDLYFFLKGFNIVYENRVPNKKYIEQGYLVASMGSRCSYHNGIYPSTKFTEDGIKWLLNEVFPDMKLLLDAEAKGLNLKEYFKSWKS